MRQGNLRMKRTILAAIIAILAVCLTGCSKAGDIKVTSCDLVSLSPAGLRSIDGTVAVGIHNPIFGFKVTGTSGKVYYKGSELVDFTVDDFDVNGKSDEKYNLMHHWHAGYHSCPCWGWQGTSMPPTTQWTSRRQLRRKGCIRPSSATGFRLRR